MSIQTFVNMKHLPLFGETTINYSLIAELVPMTHAGCLEVAVVQLADLCSKNRMNINSRKWSTDWGEFICPEKKAKLQKC